MTRKIYNTSPGGVRIGKLVPGTHKRCELGHTVIRQCDRGDQRIREVIPVPDSIWKGTTFVHLKASEMSKCVLNLNLNGLLVIRQIDNISPGGECARREISPWLSQEMRIWTHSHQTFPQRRSKNQAGHSSGKKLLLYASLLAEGI